MTLTADGVSHTGCGRLLAPVTVSCSSSTENESSAGVPALERDGVPSNISPNPAAQNRDARRTKGVMAHSIGVGPPEQESIRWVFGTAGARLDRRRQPEPASRPEDRGTR